MAHGPELLLSVHTLEELQGFLTAIDKACILDLVEQLATFVTSQLGRDVIHHDLMCILAKAVYLRTAKQELQLSQSNVRQAVHAPLDDASVEVTGEVGEGSVRVSRERSQGE